MCEENVKSVLRVSVLAAGLLCFVGLAHALPNPVSPPMINATLPPGGSLHVDKTVIVPALPPKMDICFLVDLSGSYIDDLPNIKALAGGIFDAVKLQVNDVQFCLGSFVDYPFPGWGSASSGDYAYRLDQDLTPTKATWLTAINAMTTRNGADLPESQYEGLFQMATGLGRDVPPPGVSFGDVAAGLDASFRPDASKVIIITTDASFHFNGDFGSVFPYPGPTRNDTVDALNAAGITVIALKAPGSGAQMNDIAAATGGVVETTSSNSDDIADAILDALDALMVTVQGEPKLCDPLDITFNPTSILSGGDETLEFMEWIDVPSDVTGADLPADGKVHCTVDFTADDAVLGTQSVWITVKRNFEIDIKPNSDPNSINTRAQGGLIPVAILGSETLDVFNIDVTTLSFGPNMATPAHEITSNHYVDVNDDGFTDFVSHYVRGQTGIMAGDTEACIKGKTLDGIHFMGCDAVRTTPNND